MKLFITEEEIEKALDYLRENAAVAAKARAERLYLEKYGKSLLGMIMAEHSKMAVNGQEREAHRDERYLLHLRAFEEAVFRDEQHHFKLEACKALLSAWQTMHKVELAMQI